MDKTIFNAKSLDFPSKPIISQETKVFFFFCFRVSKYFHEINNFFFPKKKGLHQKMPSI